MNVSPLDILPLSSWINTEGKPFGNRRPCSAETEEQMLETATQIKEEGFAHVIRAGCGNRELVQAAEGGE